NRLPRAAEAERSLFSRIDILVALPFTVGLPFRTAHPDLASHLINIVPHAMTTCQVDIITLSHCAVPVLMLGWHPWQEQRCSGKAFTSLNGLYPFRSSTLRAGQRIKCSV